MLPLPPKNARISFPPTGLSAFVDDWLADCDILGYRELKKTGVVVVLFWRGADAPSTTTTRLCHKRHRCHTVAQKVAHFDLNH